MMNQTPTSADLLENDFLDYLNYVLIDYDDAQWESHVKRVMLQIESLKRETLQDHIN
jgi:hypothetical protein